MIYGVSYEARGRCTETSESDRRPVAHSTMISEIGPTVGVSSPVYCDFMAALWLHDFFFFRAIIRFRCKIDVGTTP